MTDAILKTGTKVRITYSPFSNTEGEIVDWSSDFSNDITYEIQFTDTKGKERKINLTKDDEFVALEPIPVVSLKIATHLTLNDFKGMYTEHVIQERIDNGVYDNTLVVPAKGSAITKENRDALLQKHREANLALGDLFVSDLTVGFHAQYPNVAIEFAADIASKIWRDRDGESYEDLMEMMDKEMKRFSGFTVTKNK